MEQVTPIKQVIRQSGIRQWQIAERLRINESQFSKMLRREPARDFREQILDAIKEIQETRQ